MIGNGCFGKVSVELKRKQFVNLRELMTERILFVCDEEDLAKNFGLTPSGIEELADLDLLELFEEVHGLNGELK